MRSYRAHAISPHPPRPYRGDINKSKIPRELQKLAPFFHDIDLGNSLNTTPEVYKLRGFKSLFPISEYQEGFEQKAKE